MQLSLLQLILVGCGVYQLILAWQQATPNPGLRSGMNLVNGNGNEMEDETET